MDNSFLKEVQVGQKVHSVLLAASISKKKTCNQINKQAVSEQDSLEKLMPSAFAFIFVNEARLTALEVQIKLFKHIIGSNRDSSR